MNRFIHTLIAFAISYMAPAYAHEVHHADGTKQDYSTWMRPYQKISCCNDKDCEPVKYRYDHSGELFMLINNNWTHVPSQYILKNVQITDGRAHWCGIKSTVPIMHYCAAVPPQDAKLGVFRQFAYLD